MVLNQQLLSFAFDATTSAQIEITWQMASESFASNGGQILINPSVYKLIGAAGVEELKVRLSMFLGNVPVLACRDPSRNIIRIARHPNYPSKDAVSPRTQSSTSAILPQLHSNIQGNTQTPALRAFGKKTKVPRPPNAFILYRQHWHPHYRQHNKSMHNNDISKEIGKRWKLEPDSVKEKYKNLAEELKAKHAAQYPDYQYAPRKPGEKKRRMTARKLERLRQARGTQESSSFPSPGTSSMSGIDTASPNASTGKDTNGNIGGFEYPQNDFDDILEASPPPHAIQYQVQDSYVCMLPSSHDNIQSEIQEECGDYNQNYIDVAHDIDADELPEQHLLQGGPGLSMIEKQAEWESLIDWQALNHSMGVAEEMASYIDDLAAEQRPGPNNSHMTFEALDTQWPNVSSI